MRNRPFLANAVSTVMLQILFETCALNQEGVTCNEKEMSHNLPFCLPKDYRKDVGPFTTDPLNVTIVAVFEDIAEVNDGDNTVKFSVELSIEWVDPRLMLDHNLSMWNDDDISYVSLNTEWFDYLWRPDIDIVNAVDFKIKILSLGRKKVSFIKVFNQF